MNTNAQLNRRQFLRSTAQAATLVAAASATAPAVFSGESPAKTIGVGCIGLGTRGGDLLNAVVPVPGVKVTAVCDVYKPHLQKGVERSQNPDVKSYLDYRELLADPRVDAVVIGTPDHWHCPMVLAAAKAGKDIYCEKGFPAPSRRQNRCAPRSSRRRLSSNSATRRGQRAVRCRRRSSWPPASSARSRSCAQAGS